MMSPIVKTFTKSFPEVAHSSSCNFPWNGCHFLPNDIFYMLHTEHGTYAATPTTTHAVASSNRGGFIVGPCIIQANFTVISGIILSLATLCICKTLSQAERNATCEVTFVQPLAD